MEDLIIGVLSVFAWSFFSFWSAIPAGIALGLPPLLVLATVTTSYVCGVVLVVLPGGRLRAWVMQHYGDRAEDKPDSAIRRAWRRYGVIGLGLLAPMTVGAQIGAVVGISLNVAPRRLLVWMSLGALVWSILITAAVLLGLLGMQSVLA